MLLKDGMTSKNMLPRGLTSLLDLQLLGLLLLLLLVLLELMLHASKTPLPYRNDLQKQVAPRLHCLTLPSEPTRSYSSKV